MRLSRSVVLAALLSVGAASAVEAQTSLFSGTYTGGSNFNTTASVSLAYSYVSSGVYLFTLNVTNIGDSPSVPNDYAGIFMAIGLFNLPKNFGIVDAASSLSGWHLPPPNDLNGDGLTKYTTAFIAPSPAPTNGLHVGDPGATFKFELSGFSSLAQVTSVGAGIHAISGPNGCSTKLGVQNGAVVRSVDGNGLTDACMATVPEPASTALLATGLLGLFGFAWIRRKRGQPVVWEQAA